MNQVLFVGLISFFENQLKPTVIPADAGIHADLPNSETVYGSRPAPG
jgi:hypothetical protein